MDPRNWSEQLSVATSNTIFLHTGTAIPRFDVTFNVQLYHYGERVRLGESSGSIHASAGIPVILEMNGSERIEQLEVIKVPYSDSSRIDSADIRSAAQQIVKVIDSNEYIRMLSHNRLMAHKWSYQEVAKLYIHFLKSLADTSTAPGGICQS